MGGELNTSVRMRAHACVRVLASVNQMPLPYIQCTLCSSKFKKRYNVLKHMRVVHKLNEVIPAIHYTVYSSIVDASSNQTNQIVSNPIVPNPENPRHPFCLFQQECSLRSLVCEKKLKDSNQ